MNEDKDQQSCADQAADSLIRKSISDPELLKQLSIEDVDEKFQEHIEKQNKLLKKLSEVSFDNAECEIFISSIQEFRESHGRFLYSEITGYCHEEEELETLVSNTKKVYLFCQSNGYKSDNEQIAKMLLKLYDHVSLVDKQKARSKMLRDGMDRRISEQKKELEDLEANIQREEKELNKFHEKLSSMKSDLIGQLISLIAMFIAVAFVVFGGINSLNSISDLLRAIVEQENPSVNLMPMIYKSIVLWAIGMFNVLFMLMYSIGQLADKKFSFFEFRREDRPVRTFLSRYSILIIVNIIGVILVWRVL